MGVEAVIPWHDPGALILWVSSVIGALGAIGTAVGLAVRRWITRPIKTWVEGLVEQPLAEIRAEVSDARDDITEIREQVGTIRDEVTPNGGGSLKDQVVATRAELSALAQRHSDHLINHPRG